MIARVVRLREIACGPSATTARGVAGLRARLRRGDVRAYAAVLVYPDGAVVTSFAGSEDGHHHRLASGIATLSHRFFRDAGQ